MRSRMAEPKVKIRDATKSVVLRRLIRARWSEDRGEHAILEEVRASVGYEAGGSRSADVLIASCWGKGRGLIGIEIKASRSDWLRELKAGPDKRSRLEDACGELWVVAWSGVVKPEELPQGWGLLERRGVSLAVVRAAPQRKVESVPIGYVLSIMRNARQTMPTSREETNPTALKCLRFLGEDITPDRFAEIVDSESSMALAAAQLKVNEAQQQARESLSWKHQLQRLVTHVGGLAYAVGAEEAHDLVAKALTSGGTLTPMQRRAIDMLKQAATVTTRAFQEDGPG